MKPVSERRYPHEPLHNLPLGREQLAQRAKREAQASGVAFDNDQSEIRYEDGMMVVTLYGAD